MIVRGAMTQTTSILGRRYLRDRAQSKDGGHRGEGFKLPPVCDGLRTSPLQQI